MSEPFAYLNGRLIPQSQLAIKVYDAGFVQGVAVSEQLRTFGGQIFRLQAHLERLTRSLAIIDVQPQLSISKIAEIAQDLVDRNHAMLSEGDDLGLSIFITPGPYATFAPPNETGPTLCLHTYPLPFHLWSDLYKTGQRLVITDVAQVPASCWPTELKCRSRMHYYLAEQKAQAIDPEAKALLLDEQGYIAESSTANLLLFNQEEGLISPPKDKILPGISAATVEELAGQIGIPFSRRDLTPEDAASADELLLCSTSPCVWSVVRLNDDEIATGGPGPVFEQLLRAWSELVGIDIRAQAERFSKSSARR